MKKQLISQKEIEKSRVSINFKHKYARLVVLQNGQNNGSF